MTEGIWVVVKIMAPFWVPIIIRHLIFRVPQKGDQNFDNYPYISLMALVRPPEPKLKLRMSLPSMTGLSCSGRSPWICCISVSWDYQDRTI